MNDFDFTSSSKTKSTVKGKKFVLEGIHLQRMYLSATQWATCKTKLEWKAIEFKKANSTKVPKDLYGVYSFVAIPNIANHPACAYLLYVGKADKTSFRGRYYDYLHEKEAGDEARRIYLEEMLSKLDGFLWFYYAPISNKKLIGKIEEELLSAYLPPTNKRFPGKIKKALDRIFGN